MKRMGVLRIGLAIAISIMLPGLAQAQQETSEKMCGVNWVAHGAITRDDIIPLAITNANWIAQSPSGWQASFDSPVVQRIGADDRDGERSEASLIRTARLASEYGMKTMLRPVLWLADGKQTAEINMPSPEAWQAWFASYGEFLRYHAELAQKYGFDALCIGTELAESVRQRPQYWRALIAEIRQIFRGKLLYAANWNDEIEAVPFWDVLDYVGIQAYFPLTPQSLPTVDELEEAWQPHLRRILNAQQSIAKPVVFTEIGYRSVPDAASAPGNWLGDDAPVDSMSIALGLQTQARCYEAFFRVFWEHDWFAGAFFWRWFAKHIRSGGAADASFTPQNKPAQYVLREWYGRALIREP